MFGLIGSLVAVPGKREELVGLLLAGEGQLPGCLSYIVALDRTDPDRLWVTEVWASEAHHRASLSLPPVQAAMAAGRPLIAQVGTYTLTEPAGGLMGRFADADGAERRA
jgi:quinol monooxygenase YgiN